MVTFGDVLKDIRNKKGYTQEQLAKILEVSKSTIGMWETGKRLPSYELLEDIADRLNVDMAYLLGKQDTPQLIPINCIAENDTIIQIKNEMLKMDEKKLILLLAYIKALNDT